MKMKNWSKHIGVAFLLLLNQWSYGQDFVSDVVPVKKSGYYKIKLSEEVITHIGTQTAGLRIFDLHKNEIPYTVSFDEDRSFVKYTNISLLHKEIIKDSLTRLDFLNFYPKSTDQILLKTANTKNVKSYSLYGSMDQKSWFLINGNQTLEVLYDDNETFVRNHIDVIPTDYKYLSIRIKDTDGGALNVLALEKADDIKIQSKHLKISDSNYKISRFEKGKKTIFKIILPKEISISYIEFKNHKNKYFFRNGQILATDNSNSTRSAYPVENIVLKSDETNLFKLNNRRYSTLTVIIDNKDDAPLKFSEINLYQQPIYLITALEKNKKYSLSQNETLTKPFYDLELDQIANSSIVGETQVTNLISTDGASSTHWGMYVLWIGIGIGGIFVIRMAIKLLK